MAMTKQEKEDAKEKENTKRSIKENIVLHLVI